MEPVAVATIVDVSIRSTTGQKNIRYASGGGPTKAAALVVWAGNEFSEIITLSSVGFA